MKTVLIVEDNAGIREMVRDYLIQAGLQVRVAADGQEGLLEVRHHHPDLILLDVMMPKVDGLTFLRQLRAAHATPVILLTARDAELDKVLGLELGADDYVTKPFSLAELLARVRAHLRRSTEPTTNEVLRVGPLELNPEARSVRVHGASVTLTRSEFDLLAVFARHPERVFTRGELLDHLQEDATGAERTIDVHVRNLRGKIEAQPSKPRLLETVFGVGYRLHAEDAS